MKNLIIFLIPPENTVNGGIRSIFSLAQESRRFKSIHNSHVIISVYPGHESYKKNTNFTNNEYIFSFKEITIRYPKINSLILHIPEYSAKDMGKNLFQYRTYLSNCKNLQINILNQNIELMPDASELGILRAYTSNLTQTTAHDRYCSQKLANKYAMPTHLFSTLVDKRQYKTVKYNSKTNRILISNDKHTLKTEIIDKINNLLPNYEVKLIENMTYETYKELIADSKYCITFGEGFDGYYVEPLFSGSISFTVYNDQFFPNKDYLKLSNVYKSYEDMLQNIINDILSFDTESKYSKIVEKNLNLINKKYKFENYLNNIKLFYENKYSYLPNRESVKAFYIEALKKSYLELFEVDQYSKSLKNLIIKKNKIINFQNRKIEAIVNSKSWIITKPLRAFSNKIANRIPSDTFYIEDMENK